jgi:hypothetical protein
MNSPFSVFAICLLSFLLSEHLGAHLRKTGAKPDETERKDIEIILGAVLTLFALVVGFSFSMATGRYDDRKHQEAEEAVAIEAEYALVGLLPASDAVKARALLKQYLDQRALFYTTADARQLDQTNATANQLGQDLWSTIERRVETQPTPVGALIARGMNEVLDSRTRTQAAWWNRIPIAAWGLMLTIGICCNVLFGYNAHPKSRNHLLLALPVIFSVAFFLLADLDSPRGGLIRVAPRNLMALATDLAGH